MASRGVVASILMAISYFVPFLMIASSIILAGVGPFGGAAALLIISNIFLWIGVLGRTLIPFLIGVFFVVFAHFVLWRNFKSLERRTGIDAFGTASLFMLLAAIFMVLGVGLILALIGWVFSAVGYNLLEEKEKSQTLSGAIPEAV